MMTVVMMTYSEGENGDANGDNHDDVIGDDDDDT